MFLFTVLSNNNNNNSNFIQTFGKKKNNCNN